MDGEFMDYAEKNERWIPAQSWHDLYAILIKW